MTEITIFVADDHTVVRHGLKLILETQSDFTIVGEADNGRDALAQVGQSCPDIVIMDIAMPDLNGIEAARLIRDVCPATQIILLTMHSPTNLIIRAIQAGVKGYLLKGVASSELITAVHTVYSNQRYLDKKIVKQLGSKALDKPEAQGITDPLDKLSSREREVLQLVVEGRSSAEIAEKLSLSIKTIETYRHRLMRKLDINDIPSLVKFAIRHRLTPLE